MRDKGLQLIDNNDEGTVLDVKIEPVRDASGKIASGFVVGDTLEQNKALILLSHPGDLKYRPDLGVGLQDMLLSADYLEFRHRIGEHFSKDKLITGRIDLYKDKPFRIDAKYNN